MASERYATRGGPASLANKKRSGTPIATGLWESLYTYARENRADTIRRFMAFRVLLSLLEAGAAGEDQ